MTDDSRRLLFTESEIETLATPTASAAPRQCPAPRPRVNQPERLQVELRCQSLDQRLDAEHAARLVGQLVEALDVAPPYSQIDAVEGNPGPTPRDPPGLLARC